MEYWKLEELEAIAANPKRKHVRMLIEEIRRLTAIASRSEQLQNYEYFGETEQLLRKGLKDMLAAPRTPIKG